MPGLSFGRRMRRSSMITSRTPGKPADPIDPIEPDPGDQTDPADTADAVVRRAHAAQPCRSPAPAERTDAGTGLTRLIRGDTARATELLAPLDFSVIEATDPETVRPYALAVSGATERAWGLYQVD